MVGRYKSTDSASRSDDAAPTIDRPMLEAPHGTELDDEDVAGPGPGSMAAAAPWGARQSLDPGLYLVATPIGNLQDITLRALTVLRSASLVLAEDTRHTGKLLAAFGIRTTMASYHSHNEKERTRQVVDRLKGGEVRRLSGMGGVLPHYKVSHGTYGLYGGNGGHRHICMDKGNALLLPCFPLSVPCITRALCCDSVLLDGQ